MGHAYPPDLARYVAEHWPKEEEPLAIPPLVLTRALSIAFHASMTNEEARPTRFRLLLEPPDRLPESGEPNNGVLRLLFDHHRPFTSDELRRLAPAVPFETALIGAQVAEDDELRIWGVAHSGPAWLAPTWGGRSLVPNWTVDPIIHVTGPGQLAVRRAGKLIGAIERGFLVDAMMDVFESEWLPAMFEREREEVRAAHSIKQTASPSPTEAEHSLIGVVGQHALRRAIRVIRSAHHGGMMLFADTSDARALSGLRLKYRVEQDEPARRYRTLLLRILDEVAGATTKASVGWEDFASSPSAALAKLEGAVFEWSRVIANLAAIDGAVVLDKRLGLIGFGAEVSGDLPTPDRVFYARDIEGVQRRSEEVESVGTRHRAAYRFVHDHPGALAIVVSHDGGVSFVANRAGEVVIWEQSVSP